MRGYVFVDAAALTTQKKLAYWIGLALDYNAVAKLLKKEVETTVKAGGYCNKSDYSPGISQSMRRNIVKRDNDKYLHLI